MRVKVGFVTLVALPHASFAFGSKTRWRHHDVPHEKHFGAQRIRVGLAVRLKSSIKQGEQSVLLGPNPLDVVLNLNGCDVLLGGSFTVFLVVARVGPHKVFFVQVF